MKNLIKSIWKIIFREHPAFWSCIILYFICCKLIVNLTKDILFSIVASLVVVSIMYFIFDFLYSSIIKELINDIKLEKKILDDEDKIKKNIKIKY